MDTTSDGDPSHPNESHAIVIRLLTFVREMNTKSGPSSSSPKGVSNRDRRRQVSLPSTPAPWDPNTYTHHRGEDLHHPSGGHRTRNRSHYRRSVSSPTSVPNSHLEVPIPLRPHQFGRSFHVRWPPNQEFYRGTISTNPDLPRHLRSHLKERPHLSNMVEVRRKIQSKSRSLLVHREDTDRNILRYHFYTWSTHRE